MKPDIRQEFSLKSADHSERDLVLSIDYNTFLALGFDGYDGEELRAFIRQEIERGNISVRCASLSAEIAQDLEDLAAYSNGLRRSPC